MHKRLRESLGMPQIFALIEAKGEVCASVKRSKLAKTHNKQREISAEYQHCQQFIKLIRHNPLLREKLGLLFSHLPELALKHFGTSDSLALHEFFEIKSFLWHYTQLREHCCQQGMMSLHPLPDMQEMFQALDPDGNGLPTFRISPLYSCDLQHLLDKQQDTALKLKHACQADLEAARKSLGMPNLKNEFVLSRNSRELTGRLQASGHFVISSENLANYAFKLIDSAKVQKLKLALQDIAESLRHAEAEILQSLSQKVKSQLKELEQACQSAAELAWDFCLAEFALNYNCCIPQLVTDTEGFAAITLVEAVNLPLKLALEDKKRSFQTLNIQIDNSANLITGPNMGGKSTALITIGQMFYLASLGVPLPAKQATLPLYDEIYYNHDSGESSDTLSSFGREVVSLVTALERKGSKLILLDEFAKGTNPAEGEAICVATIRYLQQSPYTLIAATHFSAPTKLPNLAHYSIKGIDDASFEAMEKMSETSLENRLKLLSEAMDYSLLRLPESTTPPQCAVKIATLLGLPPGILKHLQR